MQLANLSIGVPMVILPRFAEIPVLEAIQKYRVTWALVVPPVLISLLNSTLAPSYDLSSLRAVMSAAAPLGNEVVVAFENKFKVWITQAYGLTEVSPISHIMTVDEAKTRPGKIGRLVPTFEARIVGDTPERGELWLAGPSVMKGYWRNPTATANTFEGRWFKTGDIAIKDHEGYFSIVDRVKELIKYKGFQGESQRWIAVTDVCSRAGRARIVAAQS
jgi:acyl-CoA synthetase (AMP-forming)/AMP-acid ligase II